jgi:hypothetical protein
VLFYEFCALFYHNSVYGYPVFTTIIVSSVHLNFSSKLALQSKNTNKAKSEVRFRQLIPDP